MLIQKTTLKDIGAEKTLRYDVDYIKFHQTHTKDYYTFNDLFSISSDCNIDGNTLSGDFKYCEIGNSDKNGDIEPVCLNFSIRNLEYENYYTKIEKGDIAKANLNDILIAKVRPNLKKYIRITQDKKDVYFTTAFIRLKAKEMPDLLYYSLRSIFYEDLMAIARQGKGYPTINEKDLVTLRFDSLVIDSLRTNYLAISALINDVESKITDKKSTTKSAQKIIDSVFQREFSISSSDYESMEDNRQLNISYQNIAEANSNLRMSYRWNKSLVFQNYMKAHVLCSSYLGSHILSTKNGWSPSCTDDGSGYQVLGIDSILRNGILSFDHPKYSSMPKKDFDTYLIKNNDFFISRGNTVDLVSLAAVADFDENEMPDTIYPDLMIRVEFDSSINRKYMAYVFNSFIGRSYFKYCTKGKNQTMVKVSPKELSDFVAPIPDIIEQQRIVDEIQAEINQQKEIQKEIADLRNQIDEIILQSISAK